MNSKDQDQAKFWKKRIRKRGMTALEFGSSNFIRERKCRKSKYEIPVMCSGCLGFFAKIYKTHHRLLCLASGTNIMPPIVSVKVIFNIISITQMRN